MTHYAIGSKMKIMHHVIINIMTDTHHARLINIGKDGYKMKNDESIAMTALYNIKVRAEGMPEEDRLAVLGSASVIKHELRDLEEENKYYHKIIMWCCGLAGVCMGGCLVMLVNLINNI